MATAGHGDPGRIIEPLLAQTLAKTSPFMNQANDGIYLGSSTPGVANWAIAPTQAPVFSNVPMLVFVWSPITAPTLVEPVSIGVWPSRMTDTGP